MRHNAHKGSVFLPVNGEEVEVRFDWDALSAMYGLLGEDWEEEFARVCKELDTRGLAEVLGISTRHSAGWWLEQSPPFIPTAQAVRQALTLSFFGAGGLEPRNPMVVLRQMISSLLPSKRGSLPGDQLENSGA